MDYNERMVAKNLDKWLEPVEDLAESETCYGCYGISEYEINGRHYCAACAKSDFADYSVDEAMCEFCGEVTDRIFYVCGDRYCESCFDSEFHI